MKVTAIGDPKVLKRFGIIWDATRIIINAYYNAMQRLTMERMRRLQAMTGLLTFAARYAAILPLEAMEEVRGISETLIKGVELEAEIVNDLVDVVIRETTLPEEKRT